MELVNGKNREEGNKMFCACTKDIKGMMAETVMSMESQGKRTVKNNMKDKYCKYKG